MKIQVLTASVLLALFATTSASAHSTKLTATNNAADSIAVGGLDSVGGTGFPAPLGATLSTGIAIAGSIVVDDCGCYDDVTLRNKSRKALAVGNAGAGSIIME